MSQFTQSQFQDEIRSAQTEPFSEPLLPIEKKLIGFSLGLGIVLLVVLATINHLNAL
jgi:hypothetical protein